MGVGFLSLGFMAFWSSTKSDQADQGRKPFFTGYVQKKIADKYNSFRSLVTDKAVKFSLEIV